jgi:hypothetical protein
MHGISDAQPENFQKLFQSSIVPGAASRLLGRNVRPYILWPAGRAVIIFEKDDSDSVFV